MNSQVQGLSIQCYIYNLMVFICIPDAHRKFSQRKIQTIRRNRDGECVCGVLLYLCFREHVLE